MWRIDKKMNNSRIPDITKIYPKERLEVLKKEMENHQFVIIPWPAMGGKNYVATKIGNEWLKEGKYIIFATNSNLCLFNQRGKFIESDNLEYCTFHKFSEGREVIPKNYNPENTIIILDEVGLMDKSDKFTNMAEFLKAGFKIICLGDPQQINMSPFLIEAMSLAENLNEALDWSNPFNQNVFGYQYVLNKKGIKEYPYVRAAWLSEILPYMEKHGCRPHILKYEGEEHFKIKELLTEGFEGRTLGAFEYHKDWRYTTSSRELRDHFAGEIERLRNNRRKVPTDPNKILETKHAGKIYSGTEVLIRKNSNEYVEGSSNQMTYYNGDRAYFMMRKPDGVLFKLVRNGDIVKLSGKSLDYIYPAEITTIQLFQGNHEDKVFCHIFIKGYYSYNNIYAAATRSTKENLFIGIDPWNDDRIMSAEESAEYLTRRFAAPTLAGVIGRFESSEVERKTLHFLGMPGDAEYWNDLFSDTFEELNISSTIISANRLNDDGSKKHKCSRCKLSETEEPTDVPCNATTSAVYFRMAGSSSIIKRTTPREFYQHAIQNIPASVRNHRVKTWKKLYEDGIRSVTKANNCFDDWWYFVNPDTDRSAPNGRFNRLPKVAAFVRDNPKIFGRDHLPFIREILSEYTDDVTDFVKCFDICYEYMLEHKGRAVVATKKYLVGKLLTDSPELLRPTKKPRQLPLVSSTTSIDEAKQIAEEYLEISPASPMKKYSYTCNGAFYSEWSKNMLSKKDATLSAEYERKIGKESWVFINLKDTGISVLDGDDKDSPDLKNFVLAYFKSKGIDPLREESPDNYGFHILGYSLKKSTGERTIHKDDSPYKADFLTDKRNQALFRKNKVTKGRDFVDWNEHIGFLQQFGFNGISVKSTTDTSE